MIDGMGTATLVLCAEATADSRQPMHLRVAGRTETLCGAEAAYDVSGPGDRITAVRLRRLHVCRTCRDGAQR